MEYYSDEVEHYCEAFPLDTEEEQEEETASSSEQYFNIKFEVRVTDGDCHPHGEEPDILVAGYSNPAEYFFPIIPRESLFKEQETTPLSSSESVLLNMLSQMGVPHNAQNFMAAKILACARDMVYRTHKVLSIAVQIFLTRVNEDEEQEPIFDEDEEDEAVDMDQGQDHDELVPATKASIEQLESLEVEGEEQKCAICLEDFIVGLRVTRMPCLHLYHENCIVDWLRKGNSCPLCRFMMPATTSATG
ncbi:hypothetical protein L6164_017959 [Bauhinia variegata]|uniref:Uncharacterized protein n=1 Tax=Bauhinia variegata TaxID=167791 RepID=A0ACB9N9R1_BAUVA|nr:hypothetical protein L6164_017959 [Bauhinia variegata]